jgi:hypothetical protein
MMRSYKTVSRVLAALVLSGAILGASASVASGATKPMSDLVPTGAKVLYWSYPLPVAAKVRDGTLTVTKASVIAGVRALINSLPVSSTAKRVCPDDMMLPITVSFAANKTSTPFTKVVFQLGGCPYARVYQHGVAVAPTLGGTHLAQVYARIQHLISPKGVPLA